MQSKRLKLTIEIEAFIKNERSSTEKIDVVTKRQNKQTKSTPLAKRTEKQKYAIFVSIENPINFDKITNELMNLNFFFVSRFLELRTAFLALQKNDHFVQRMRSLCAKSYSMKRKSKKTNERKINADDSQNNNIRKKTVVETTSKNFNE